MRRVGRRRGLCRRLTAQDTVPDHRTGSAASGSTGSRKNHPSRSENDLDDAALVRGRAGFGGCGQEPPEVEDPSGLDGAAEDFGKDFPDAVAHGDDIAADADVGAESAVSTGSSGQRRAWLLWVPTAQSPKTGAGRSCRAGRTSCPT
ncbi:hypothetical protein ACFVRD_21115 [Streptomyces sp. NPDC057908]|uniref:hypothetical protein n=1 Tax=Streptomyces sp. NPDC057908 TaxID=3346276 RepID=UPI0036E91BD8